jgi:hypothetical protein
VHALNCLKDIFTDARLSSASEPYISDCLDLAASKIESKMLVYSLICPEALIANISFQMANP